MPGFILSFTMNSVFFEGTVTFCLDLFLVVSDFLLLLDIVSIHLVVQMFTFHKNSRQGNKQCQRQNRVGGWGDVELRKFNGKGVDPPRVGTRRERIEGLDSL